MHQPGQVHVELDLVPDVVMWLLCIAYIWHDLCLTLFEGLPSISGCQSMHMQVTDTAGAKASGTLSVSSRAGGRGKRKLAPTLEPIAEV